MELGSTWDMRCSLSSARSGRESRGDAVAGVDGLTVQPAGPVGRTHERAGHDAREADLVGLVAELDELLGLDPALDRGVPHARAQVLGDGDQLAAGRVQIAQRLRDLLAGLTHAEDEGR